MKPKREQWLNPEINSVRNCNHPGAKEKWEKPTESRETRGPWAAWDHGSVPRNCREHRQRGCVAGDETPKELRAVRQSAKRQSKRVIPWHSPASCPHPPSASQGLSREPVDKGAWKMCAWCLANMRLDLLMEGKSDRRLQLLLL